MIIPDQKHEHDFNHTLTDLLSHTFLPREEALWSWWRKLGERKWTVVTRISFSLKISAYCTTAWVWAQCAQSLNSISFCRYTIYFSPHQRSFDWAVVFKSGRSSSRWRRAIQDLRIDHLLRWHRWIGCTKHVVGGCVNQACQWPQRHSLHLANLAC